MTKIYRLFLIIIAILLLTACSSAKQDGDSATEQPAPQETLKDAQGEAPVIWDTEEIPTALRYDRMWEYSAYVECSDTETIGQIVDILKSLKVGAESDMATDDFTDLLTFTFADGSKLRLEFENQNFVTEDQKRYEVDGLTELRALLGELIGPELEE